MADAPLVDEELIEIQVDAREVEWGMEKVAAEAVVLVDGARFN